MPAGLSFQNPHVLWGLLLLPLLGLAWGWQRRRRTALRHPTTFWVASLPKGMRARLVYLLPVLQALALALAVVALARPQVRDARIRDLSVEGIDIVLALDLSTSMEAADFRPNNRLYVAKEVLNDFISGRVNDRLGLVVFSGEAYTQAPLTLDYHVLNEVVRQLRTRVLEDGTAIGDALAVSLNRLRDSTAKSRVVVLITDGDNNAGRISPKDAAAMAKSLGIPIYTILVGKGGKVPFPVGKDIFGGIAWREMEIPINPQLLQDIATTTGGEAYQAKNRDELRAGLKKVLDSLERSKLLSGSATAQVREMFHPFLLWAAALVALEMLLRSTVLRVYP